VKIGSLFSGIGGLDLAVEAHFGARTVWQVEWEKHPASILARHFGVPVYGDVTTLDWSTVEPVDILCGGYPCQPFSLAGNRKGTDDPRHLWPYFAAAIRSLRPSIVVLENVAAHLGLGFDAVLGDLAEAGFDAKWTVVRASDVGAPHRRERLFVLAHAQDAGRQRSGTARDRGDGSTNGRDLAPDAGSQRYGSGQDAGLLGRVDGTDASGALQRERPREIVGDRGNEDASHGHSQGREGPEPTGRCDLSAGCGGATADTRGPGRERSTFLHGGTLGGRFAERETWADVDGLGADIEWGEYGPAVERWEARTRPAPAPVDDKGRLSPRFVEWMMGFPEGWVDGIPRTAQLKALGNAVVPVQAMYALSVLAEA
jgi:DNA (cytosine-5)-methyltransferase 1